MADPPGHPPKEPLDEMGALKAQVAALPARVYLLERRSGLAPEMPRQAVPPAQQQPPAPTPPGTMLEPPSAQIVHGPPPPPPQMPKQQPGLRYSSRKENADLEKKIHHNSLNLIRT